MTTKDQDVEFWSGDDVELVFTVKDSAGVALDLNGVSAIAWHTSKYTDETTWSSTAKVTKSLGAGIAVTDEPNGEITVTIDAADTAALDGTFYHEIQLTDAAAKTRTVATGNLTINKDLIV